jgi:hypothetical protein
MKPILLKIKPLMRIKNLIIISFLLCTFISCKQESSDLGKEFLDIHTYVSYIDTVTVDVSTVLMDSMVTSGQKVILCGTLDDGDLGEVQAKSYFQLSIPGSLSVTEDILFDSITLNLKSNGYLYGDTSQYYEVSVNELTEKITDNNEGSYFNNTGFSYNPVPLGKVRYKPRPSIKPGLEIRLSDSLGFSFLNKIVSESEDMTSQTKFLELFKGIVLIPSSSNELIMGFKGYDSTAFIRLYYKQKGAEENIYVDFSLYNSAKQFNQILIDRKGTSLENISYKNNEINSVKTDNMAYMQSSTGLAIKFSFPYIKNLTLFSKYYSVLRAELVIKPVKRTYSETFSLPETMYLYETDGSLSFGNAITDSEGNNNDGNLYIDGIMPGNTQYVYDITGYINQLLQKDNINYLGLLFFSPSLNSSLERLIVGNQNNYENKTFLRVYYVRYNE